MNVPIPKPLILTLSSIMVLVLAASGLLLMHHLRPVATGPAHSAKTQLSHEQTRQTAATTAPSAAKSSATQAAITAANAACKLLTLAVAQKVLGADAKATPPGDTATLQASDTSLSACAYASSTTGSVQLVVRTPTDALGISKNAVIFGSGKPHDAVTVQGYGQTAYWDPGKHSLNVLGNNNWYIITRSTSQQADTEAVAKLLVSEF